MLQYNVIQSFINAPCMRIYPSYSVTEISVTNNDEPESSMTNNGMYSTVHVQISELFANGDFCYK